VSDSLSGTCCARYRSLPPPHKLSHRVCALMRVSSTFLWRNIRRAGVPDHSCRRESNWITAQGWRQGCSPYCEGAQGIQPHNPRLLPAPLQRQGCRGIRPLETHESQELVRPAALRIPGAVPQPPSRSPRIFFRKSVRPSPAPWHVQIVLESMTWSGVDNSQVTWSIRYQRKLFELSATRCY
jgi:hypothetical protein